MIVSDCRLIGYMIFTDSPLSVTKLALVNSSLHNQYRKQQTFLVETKNRTASLLTIFNIEKSLKKKSII